MLACPQSCTYYTTALIVPLTDHFLPTSHLSSAPIADCGALEIQHRTPSLPSPPRGVRCPPPWARAAQTALQQCSALGRWPPGETGLVCLSSPLHGRSGASSWETTTPSICIFISHSGSFCSPWCLSLLPSDGRSVV